MKRIAIVLSALALTGAVAFAEDAAPVAKLSGYVNAGVVVTSTSDGVTYKSRANDFGYDGWVGKLTGSVSAPTYGVTVTADVKQGGTVSADTAYAWVSPVTGLKLEAGSGNDNPLGEVDNNGAGSFSTAGLTAVYSMGGLTAGVVVSPSTTAASSAPVTLGARYALDKVATFNLTGGTAAAKFDWVRATASLSAVPNLNASVGYNSTGLSGTASTMIDVEAGYMITEALKADVVVWSYSGNSPATTLQYKPNVSYNLGNGMSVSAYLQGDNNKVQANYEAQGEFDLSIGAAGIHNQVKYDTAPNHVKGDKAATTLETDLVFSF